MHTYTCLYIHKCFTRSLRNKPIEAPIGFLKTIFMSERGSSREELERQWQHGFASMWPKDGHVVAHLRPRLWRIVDCYVYCIYSSILWLPEYTDIVIQYCQLWKIQVNLHLIQVHDTSEYGPYCHCCCYCCCKHCHLQLIIHSLSDGAVKTIICLTFNSTSLDFVCLD